MSSEATASTLLIDTTDTSSIVNEPSTPDMQGQTTQNKDVAAVAARQEVPNTTSEQQIAAAGVVTAAGSVTPPSATPAASALKRKDHPSPSSPRSANSVTFADLKAAQRRSMKALREIALTEINSLEPQMPEASRREIAAVLQAHVNEMSSSTFTHLSRVYFPTELQSTKKTESPVDPAALARIKDLEAQIHATEQRIHAHQSRLPTTIRDILHANFAAQAKALEVALSSPSKVPVTDSDGTSIKYSEEDIAAVKATFARISAKIDQLNTKLPMTMQQATDTIHVVEHAMKRPKSRFDALMEQDNVTAPSAPPSSTPPPTLRAKLAQSL